jgi:hypothetical protein
MHDAINHALTMKENFTGKLHLNKRMKSLTTNDFCWANKLTMKKCQ